MINTEGSVSQQVTYLFMLLPIFFLIALGCVVWAFFDARKRGKSGILVALMVLLLPWPIGLLAWLVFRPSIGDTGGTSTLVKVLLALIALVIGIALFSVVGISALAVMNHGAY